jgi:hypothetical protein
MLSLAAFHTVVAVAVAVALLFHRRSFGDRRQESGGSVEMREVSHR